MNEVLDGSLRALLLGVGATAVMDLGGLLLQRIANITPPNYTPVGRWIAYMPRGQFCHASIAASAPIRHEATLGWLVHYTVGIVFAAMLLLIWGSSWLCAPSIEPALTVGLVSVLAPFLLMQPAMGAGIAASRTPNPRAARLRSLGNHLLFGIGLYVAGRMLALLGIC